ncbi:MAG: hypothetical protein JXB05_28765 [Myxococcaceae bacterium]|nr:hypothetical protein [Myxococcaceae bacterium]
MRRPWSGFVVLLLAVGCAHEGKLRPEPGAVPVSEDENAAVTGAHGVRLVAYGSSWEARPRDVERYFTLVQVRLENASGRPLSIRYAGFELEGKERHVARKPEELGEIIAARVRRFRPASDVYRSRLPPRTARAVTPSDAVDSTYNSYNGTTPYTPPPCHTCPSEFDAAALPSQDMLRLALAEGPLESGQVRDGFLYFEEPLLGEQQVTLRVKLVDASTEEPFGELSIPFEVH